MGVENHININSIMENNERIIIMIKIFLTVRNRLAITRKAITALKQHSKLGHQIYVYDNLTNYKVQEHFEYFYKLYRKGAITQVTFNTQGSTFNAFSKAVACNQFGHLHEDDPQKDNCDFLLFLDNDIIVTDGWDQVVRDAWRDVKARKMNNVKAISQFPAGIRHGTDCDKPFAGKKAVTGKLGGSGFWAVRPDFFRDVGFLDLRQFVGHNKRHDQVYWTLMSKASGGKNYIMGLKHLLGVHCGGIAGSVCNVLTRNKKHGKKEDLIKFEKEDENIDAMDFTEFYKHVTEKVGNKNW